MLCIRGEEANVRLHTNLLVVVFKSLIPFCRTQCTVIARLWNGCCCSDWGYLSSTTPIISFWWLMLSEAHSWKCMVKPVGQSHPKAIFRSNEEYRKIVINTIYCFMSRPTLLSPQRSIQYTNDSWTEVESSCPLQSPVLPALAKGFLVSISKLWNCSESVSGRLHAYWGICPNRCGCF